MNHPKTDSQRRHLLKAAGGALLASSALSLLGCSQRSSGGAAAVSSAAPPAAGRWASGGTQKIGDATQFPDPFAHDTATACVLTCMATMGPCHASSPERLDVSDGWDGLPLRLALRVVDSGCRPVPGAWVEIWHANHTGGYSGDIRRMCTNNQDDRTRQFFRGYQRTDASGRVNFNTCYPGWYRGRAVHIHLRVMTGEYDGSDRAASAVTTQLLFTDELNHEIFTTHPQYQRYGEPDTKLDRDGVIGAEQDKTPWLFDVHRMDDGVMFASKTLVIRKSLDESVCEAQGVPPPGGFGPPPDGMTPPPDGFGPPPADGFGPPPSRGQAPS